MVSLKQLVQEEEGNDFISVSIGKFKIAIVQGEDKHKKKTAPYHRVIIRRTRGTPLSLKVIEPFSLADSLYDTLRTYKHWRHKHPEVQKIFKSITKHKFIKFRLNNGKENKSYINVNHPEFDGDVTGAKPQNKVGVSLGDMRVSDMTTKTNRPKNVLERHGYTFIKNIPTTKKELKKLKGMGDGAAQQIIDFLSSFKKEEVRADNNKKSTSKKQKDEKILIKDMTTDTERPKNVLERAGYKYVNDIPRNYKELKSLKGMGKKSAKQILKFLKEKDLL